MTPCVWTGEQLWCRPPPRGSGGDDDDDDGGGLMSELAATPAYSELK